MPLQKQQQPPYYNRAGSNVKTYKALISQTSGDDPTVVILNYNDPNFLGEIRWSRDGTGLYTGVLDQAFPITKTFTTITSNINALRKFSLGRLDNDSVFIDAVLGTTNADDILSYTPIQIDVYL